MASNKKQITIDTCVLCQTEQGSDQNCIKAQTLLRKIYANCHAIVFDKPNNRILKEYKARATGYSKEWLIQILRRKNKIHKVDIQNCKISSRMKKDRSDRKFIDACYQSSDKILITRDNSFFDPYLRFWLKKHGITLVDVEGAMALV